MSSTAPTEQISRLPTLRVSRRFPVRPGQIVVWQLAVVATVLVDPRGTPGIVVGAVGLVAVLATAVRRRGRWLYQWAWLALRYRARRGTDPLAGVTVHDYADRGGNHTGVAVAGRSCTAVLRVGPMRKLDPMGLLRPLRAAYDRAELPAAAVQLVVWTVPVDGGDPVRMCWLAVRCAPDAGPAAVAARGGGLGGALRATGAAALRLAHDLASDGIDSTVLDGDQLRTELTTAIGADPHREATVAEHWRSVSIGTLAQACYRPRHPDLATLLTETPAPTAFTAISATVTRPRNGTGTPDTQVLVRIGAPADQSRNTPDTAAATVTTPLQRMDGAHAAALRATLPLAVPPPAW